MNLIKKIVAVGMILVFVNFAYAKQEQININFKGLKISDLIKITSKILNKNILITQKINGEVDFISNKAVYKGDILNILLYVLESKGYTIVENNGILRVIRISDTAKYNLPVVSGKESKQFHQMITEVFNVKNSNVDYIASKIRHLISKSAKLVTDKISNAIVLTDFQSNINTVKKVIDIVVKDNEKKIEIVELKNVQASAILAELKNIAKTVFNVKVEKEKVSMIVNKDINSILFVGKEKNINFLKKYVLDIDKKGSLIERVVEVVYLKNIESKNVIKIINSVISKRKYIDKNSKPFASTDDESNSIVLMGQKDEVSYLKLLIDKLDIDRPQVYVQARIIEVKEERVNNLGVQYGLEGFSSGGSGLLTFSSALNGEGAASAISLDGLSGYGLDLASMKNGLSLGATINLLKRNRALDIVSEPSILCINNKESSIYVGETRSIQTGTTTGTTTTTNYKREDIGLKLKVKPRISSGNKVTLEIQTILEDVTETLIVGQPNTFKKEINTVAIVNNGESVILGGLIKVKKENTEDKVPFFGDIPVLGALFRNNNRKDEKINLVIIVTPYIIPKSKDLTSIREQLSQLKILEDKYTKDLELRLEERKLKTKAQDLERDEKRLGLEKASDELAKNKKEFQEEKDEYHNKKLDNEVENIDNANLTNEQLHKQRVKEIFGIDL